MDLKRIIFFNLLIILLSGAVCMAGIEDEMLSLYGKENYKVDPHWKAGECRVCHRDQVKGRELFLRGDEYTTCTICHDRGKASVEIHSVGVKPSQKITVPDTFPLSSDKKTTCLTCHDHTPACYLKDKKNFRHLLRKGPYEERLGICYRCHKKEDMKGYNPHVEQIKDGKIVENRCLFCHEKALDPKKKVERGEYKLRRKMALLCIGCHLLTPHAGALEHLVKPKDEILKIMKESEQRYGIIFPLDEAGRITCATCHNPHQQGVFEKDAPAGKKYEEEEVPGEVLGMWRQLSETFRKDIEYKMEKEKIKNGKGIEIKPRPEKNMRLSARDGELCLACHRYRWEE